MPAEVESKYGEPWSGPHDGCVYDADGSFVFSHVGSGEADPYGQVRDSMAGRAAKCVNACAGFENPDVLREIAVLLRHRVARGVYMSTGAFETLLAKLDKPAEDKEEVSA